jgi:AraC-like DNA-binding protein
VSIEEVQRVFNRQTGVKGDFIIDVDISSRSNIFKFPLKADVFALVLVTDGKGEMNVNLHSYEIRKGSFIVYTPSIIFHSIRSSAEDVVKADIFMASPEYLSDLQLDLRKLLPLGLLMADNPIIQISEKEQKHMKTHMEFMYGIATTESIYQKEIFSNACKTFIFSAAEIFANRFANDSNIENMYIKSHKDLLFQKFMLLLNENHTRERSVNFYADQLHISPKYLSTLVLEASGKKATYWINSFVVLEAKSLLKFSLMNIQEIAYALNFPNQSFFGKYFKRVTGITPSEYRKKDK